jgi:hypothetical protein
MKIKILPLGKVSVIQDEEIDFVVKAGLLSKEP